MTRTAHDRQEPGTRNKTQTVTIMLNIMHNNNATGGFVGPDNATCSETVARYPILCEVKLPSSGHL